MTKYGKGRPSCTLKRNILLEETLRACALPRELVANRVGVAKTRDLSSWDLRRAPCLAELFPKMTLGLCLRVFEVHLKGNQPFRLQKYVFHPNGDLSNKHRSGFIQAGVVSHPTLRSVTPAIPSRLSHHTHPGRLRSTRDDTAALTL